ncbi:TPA_exp: hypothetical protein A8136_4931 [Trichophyton benhamiae CBS 112371]|nr:TPA_exp: hypothetical protein A8136_4931 [Trichophyton benhamiae CBS 112371]
MRLINLLLLATGISTAAAHPEEKNQNHCEKWCIASFGPLSVGCIALASKGKGPCYECGPAAREPLSKLLCNKDCVPIGDQHCGGCGITVCMFLFRNMLDYLYLTFIYSVEMENRVWVDAVFAQPDQPFAQAFQFISDCNHVADIHVYSAVREKFALVGNAYVRLGRSTVPDRAKSCGMTKIIVVLVVLRAAAGRLAMEADVFAPEDLRIAPEVARISGKIVKTVVAVGRRAVMEISAMTAVVCAQLVKPLLIDFSVAMAKHVRTGCARVLLDQPVVLGTARICKLILLTVECVGKLVPQDKLAKMAMWSWANLPKRKLCMPPRVLAQRYARVGNVSVLKELPSALGHAQIPRLIPLTVVDVDCRAVVAIPARTAGVFVRHLVVNVIWATLVHAAAKHARISILQRLQSVFKKGE